MSRVCRYGGTSELGTFFFESQVAGMFRANIYVGASNGWDLGRNFPPIKRSNKEAQLRKWKALSPFRNAQERRQVVPAGLFFGHPSGRMGGRTLFPIHHSSSEPHHVVAEQRSRTATLWPFSLRPSFLFWLSNISSLCSLALLIADSAAAGK